MSSLRNINHERPLLLLLLLLAAVVVEAGESLSVGSSSEKQDLAIGEELSHGDYGSWTPSPRVGRSSLTPIPHDHSTRPQRIVKKA
ncbi:hypothetical protein CARUB_v10003137mg [Capsella rubella]|uniref:Uncharacterized protein n=1 Tax=Capsella rubella TaxID=81985 RepID=R0H7W1_9BRAS|nr:uncharacterized protein LOC17882035 [Capsella rubella]EOA19653.1 hypothetical protein CARUB_v10003137mg [Capsella rubella]